MNERYVQFFESTLMYEEFLEESCVEICFKLGMK